MGNNTRETNTKVVRNYKDTMFRMIFNDKKELLVLYNAINNTSYSNPDDLKITTLENAVYISMKNDISFILDMRLQLYEQQSTINPNMPLRYLLYISELYEKETIDKNIYSKKLIKLPTPKFIVFYNGMEAQPERCEIKLSEAFEIQEKNPSLELKVTQLNINDDYNEEIKKKCPTLLQYMKYVDKVRCYQQNETLENAVERAVNESIKEGILKEFLLHNKAEVVKMSIFEYDEEKYTKLVYAEGFEDGESKGIKQGIEQGIEQGEILGVIKKLVTMTCLKLKKGKTPETIADELEEELDTIKNICNIASRYEPDYDVEAISKELLQK